MEQLSQQKHITIITKIVFPSVLIVLAVVLGASRVPSGDLLMYNKIYIGIKQNFFSFYQINKNQILVEPLYYLINLFFAKVFLNFQILQGLFFAICGLLLAFRDNKFYISGLIFYICFPLYLSLNLQIIRQWIGFAILLHAINNKNGIFFFILAALFHVTCWFYVVIYLLKNASLRNLFLIGLASLFLYFVFFDYLFEYVIFKITKESLYGFDVTNGIPTILAILVLVLSYFFKSMKVLRIYLVSTVFLILLAPNGEIQFRYMYFSIMAVTYVVYGILENMRANTKRVLAIPVILLMIISQIIYISIGPYNYDLF